MVCAGEGNRRTNPLLSHQARGAHTPMRVKVESNEESGWLAWLEIASESRQSTAAHRRLRATEIS
jgi:hypothetical protein